MGTRIYCARPLHGYLDAGPDGKCPLCALTAEERQARNRRAIARSKRDGISAVQAIRLENEELVARRHGSN